MSDNELTKNEAETELAKIPLDQNFLAALQDASHPGHKTANARRRSLYDAAYGDRLSNAGEKMLDESPQDLSINEGQAFFDAPTDPKDYKFDSAPHGVPYDSELEQKARGWFHKAGIPQWLARNVVREWNRTIERQPDPRRSEGDAAATERSLRRTWGDRYEARIDAARSLVRSLKSDEAMDLLDRSGLANNEYLIRQLVALTESRTVRG